MLKSRIEAIRLENYARFETRSNLLENTDSMSWTDVVGVVKEDCAPEVIEELLAEVERLRTAAYGE